MVQWIWHSGLIWSCTLIIYRIYKWNMFLIWARYVWLSGRKKNCNVWNTFLVLYFHWSLPMPFMFFIPRIVVPFILYLFPLFYIHVLIELYKSFTIANVFFFWIRSSNWCLLLYALCIYILFLSQFDFFKNIMKTSASYRHLVF